MTPSADEKESTWAYVRTALVVFGYLARKAEWDERDLVGEVDQEIKPLDKQMLENATHKTLDDLKIELLVPGIIAAVAEKFDEALQEAKWTKWMLFIAQGFGVAGAGLLLANWDKLPPGSWLYLVIYCSHMW